MQSTDWNYRTVDWNHVWRKLHAQKAMSGRHGAKCWDNRAKDFTRAVARGDYIDQFLNICDLDPDSTILDIGAAAGTLAVPLAQKVRSVTALEPSEVMRTLLKERCDEEGLHNVLILAGRWEDDWENLGIGEYDVTIASRSLIIDNLSTAIAKLRRHTRKRVYLSTLVDDGPFDRNLVSAVGRHFEPGVDYIVVYNYLRQIGIYANLQFTLSKDQRTFANVDEAVEGLSWMVQEITEAETVRLREHLARTLIEENGRLRMPYPRTIRWAVIWWDQEGPCS